MSKSFLGVWQEDYKKPTVTFTTVEGTEYVLSGPPRKETSNRLVRLFLNKEEEKSLLKLFPNPDLNKDIKFRIATPNLDGHRYYKTFEEAMDLFEGYNPPVKIVDGVEEPFKDACNRVRKYYKN